MGNVSEFKRVVEWLAEHAHWDRNISVSVSFSQAAVSSFNGGKGDDRPLASLRRQSAAPPLTHLGGWRARAKTNRRISLANLLCCCCCCCCAQVFETNIRAVGGLVAGHILAADPDRPVSLLSLSIAALSRR